MLNILLFRQLATMISLLCRRYRTRRQLRGLDERQLQDIGVSRCEALREAARPCWQSGPFRSSRNQPE